MSRTDAHTPVHLRLARGELLAVPSHARHHDVCDLPSVEETGRYAGRTTNCIWIFFYTGASCCSCLNCHGGPKARARNRVERHGDHSALQVALGGWRGGDSDVFDELAAPVSRHRLW